MLKAIAIVILATSFIILGIYLIIISAKSFIYSLSPQYKTLKREMAENFFDYIMGRNGHVVSSKRTLTETSMECGIGITKDGKNMESRSRITISKLDEIF